MAPAKIQEPTWKSAVVRWETAVEVASFACDTSSVAVPIALAISSDGDVALAWSQEGADKSTVVVCSREANGTWTTKEVGETSKAFPRRPAVAFDEDKNLIVAWSTDVSENHGGYVLRQGSEQRWGVTVPFVPMLMGDVVLCGGKSVRSAFVKGVKKTDLKKLFGDALHDRPRDYYPKIGVAEWRSGRWEEVATFEDENLLQCGPPSLSRSRVVYARGKEDPSAVVCREPMNGSVDSVVGSTSDDEMVAVTEIESETLIGCRTATGIVVARGAPGQWSVRERVMPENFYLNLGLAGSGETGYLWAVTGSAHEVLVSPYRNGVWGRPASVATGQSAAMAGAKDGSVWIAWIDGWKGGVGATPGNSKRVVHLMRGQVEWGKE